MNLAASAVALLVVLTASGCKGHQAASPVASRGSSQSPTASASTDPTATAEEVVVAYYRRLGRHDVAGATQLLDPGLSREYLAAGADGDLKNTVSIDNIRDLKSTPAPPTPGLPAGYRDITQVFLTYDAVYRHVVAAGDGPNSRFVYVGRDRSGQWLILEIGTGP